MKSFIINLNMAYFIHIFDANNAGHLPKLLSQISTKSEKLCHHKLYTEYTRERFDTKSWYLM